jgi:hypothetical protein
MLRSCCLATNLWIGWLPKYVCMYIAGEGLKRPQHRDHPWSIVLKATQVTRNNMYLNIELIRNIHSRVNCDLMTPYISLLLTISITPQTIRWTHLRLVSHSTHILTRWRVTADTLRYLCLLNHFTHLNYCSVLCQSRSQPLLTENYPKP